MSKSSKSLPRERAQPSTAISDAVLSFLTLYSVALLVESARGSAAQGSRGEWVAQWQTLAAAAIGLTGVAAGVGSLRFAGVSAMRPLHELLAGLSMFVSVPSLGVVAILAFSSTAPTSAGPVGAVALLFGAFLAFRLFPRQLKSVHESYVLLASLFGLMCVFFRAVFIVLGKSGSASDEAWGAGAYGVVGTLLVISAAAAGTKGTAKFGPISILNVDVFHYLMALGNICLVHLFQRMWM